MPTLGLIGCAAGGLEHLRSQVIEPFTDSGWTIAVTLTPTAEQWLRATGEIDHIEKATGLPVRTQPRLPTEASPHPQTDCYAIVPATANTVAKLALGIADNQALTQACEAIGNRLPVVVFPRINAAHAQHSAWNNHIAALRQTGVHLIYGDDVWPLHQPRSNPGRQLPWQHIKTAIEQTRPQ